MVSAEAATEAGRAEDRAARKMKRIAQQVAAAAQNAVVSVFMLMLGKLLFVQFLVYIFLILW